MYLKQLDLQGFKSFPEKMKLEFNQGVTAVVGPNGSGKSNVSDAIRWVLGEQRAKNLRGDKMEDIIFVGTENRKPLGFAEVSITIDNQDQKLPIDYMEVKVTRRVFRSGESEYRINKTPCRLKDVQELFMDTGIGREGYSIISQGRIDEILNAKGEERRKLFEEATGIIKYKTRRQEALSKLDKEKQNLIRVQDITQELEAQIEPLRLQSEQAKEYLRVKELLKEAEISVLVGEMERFAKEIDVVLLQKVDREHNLKEQLHQIEVCKEVLRNWNQKMQELEEVIQKKNDMIADVLAQKQKTIGEIRLKQEQKKHDRDNQDRLTQEMQWKRKLIEDHEEKIGLLEIKHTSIQMELQQQQTILAEKEARFEALNQILSSEELETEQYKTELFEQMHHSTEKNSVLVKKEALKEQFENRMVYVEQKISQLDGRTHQTTVHTLALEKQEADKKAQSETLEFEVEDLKTIQQQQEEEKSSMQSELQGKEKQFVEIASKISLLKDMEKAKEGFTHSVKQLLQLSASEKKKRGIHGAVGELFHTEQLYEVAIEVVLGATIQNVVTETEDDAKEAINYLKKHRLGRATFLPISAVRGKALDTTKPIFSEDGVLGLASDFVSFEACYEEIALSLLGKTLVIKNLDLAVELAKKYKHQYKMVTLDGDFLHTSGSMSGGSKQKRNSHILGRAGEIQTLQEEKNLLEMKVSDLKEAFQKFSEQTQQNQKALQQKTTAIYQLALDLAQLKEKKETAIREEADFKKQLKLYQIEQEQLIEQLEKAGLEVSQLQASLQEIETLRKELESKLTGIQEAVQGEKEEKEQLLKELTQIKIDTSTHTEKINHLAQEKSRLLGEIETFEKEFSIASNQIHILKSNEQEKSKEQTVLEEQEIKLEQENINLLQSVEEMNGKKKEYVIEMEQANQDIESEKENQIKIEQEIFRLDGKIEKIEEHKKNIVDQLWNTYELTHRMAKEHCGKREHGKQEQEVSQEEMKRLKGELRALGHVNIGAVEQYEEVNERYQFLKQQQDDILQAEEKLRVMIQELSELMEEQFKEQFAIISENFSRVFREMFGGGTGYLKLTEGENILESSIDIIAQPPGKNLQNMQLLSGGERALTAIAILFGILHMKPSPFCVLDEIEAALDDANVVRYAKYLKRFSQDTQFIVITHRKGTMEYADVLYGVTMEEKGISKLVSVDFTEQVTE